VNFNKTLIRLLCGGVSLAALSFSTQADTVSVAVAANFTKPMKVIAEQFYEATGHRARLSFGSSGVLYAQVRNGAPFDLFLSADQRKPATLEQQGLAVAGSRFTYAVGRLALWSANPDLIKGNADILHADQFNKLAVANPALAPYGSAARQVLAQLNLTQQTKPKLVMGQNIAQTYQFVASGNAQVGLVALSQVAKNNVITSGSGWIIPASFHTSIHQGAVLLDRAKNNAAAKALLKFLGSDKTQATIRSFGYNTEQPK